MTYTRIRYDKINDVCFKNRTPLIFRNNNYTVLLNTAIMFWEITKTTNENNTITLCSGNAPTVHLLKIAVKKALQAEGLVFKSETRKTKKLTETLMNQMP